MEKMACSISEAAQMLGISRPTLYALLDQPGFPAFRVGNRRLISVEGLRDWIRSQTEVSA